MYYLTTSSTNSESVMDAYIVNKKVKYLRV